MTILVVGASGATGKKLVEQLIDLDHKVKIIVRSAQKVPESWRHYHQISIIEADISDIEDTQMREHVKDCDAIVSCLGHNLSWKGMYGKPRRLVADAVKKLCASVTHNEANHRVKFILMNGAGCKNHDAKERTSVGHNIVIGLIRLLLPPHSDNEKAADYLRVKMGQHNKYIDWVAVRPDSLINEDQVSEYETYPSPTRSAILDPGKTSRINVAHFMATLITDNQIWEKWKGKMPVIYNKN